MSSPLLPEFFGDTLLIVLPSTVTEISVEADLYSQWKEWIKIGDNAKFPPAFRTIGGDPLTPGIDAGAYFFLQNQDGWRIKPAEENATVLITGNLAPEDSTLPQAIPTTGTFTVLLLGLQPITQNIDVILEQTQESLYSGRVAIDTFSGDGVPGVLFPIGTRGTPSDNLADARAIADNLGFHEFEIHGNVLLDQEYEDWSFIGTSALHSIIDLNGQDVAGASFFNCSLKGSAAIIGSPLHQMFARECVIPVGEVLGEWTGIMQECLFGGDISLQDGLCAFLFCSSQIAGTETPQFEKNNNPGDLNIRAWSGGLEILNFSSGDNCSVDLISGHLKLGPTNTAGTLVLRGVGKYTNTMGSPKLTVNRDGFVDGEDITLIRALAAGDAVVSPDDLTVTVYDNSVSPRVILAVYSVSSDGRIRTRTS